LPPVNVAIQIFLYCCCSCHECLQNGHRCFWCHCHCPARMTVPVPFPLAAFLIDCGVVIITSSLFLLKFIFAVALALLQNCPCHCCLLLLLLLAHCYLLFSLLLENFLSWIHCSICHLLAEQQQHLTVLPPVHHNIPVNCPCDMLFSIATWLLQLISSFCHLLSGNSWQQQLLAIPHTMCHCPLPLAPMSTHYSGSFVSVSCCHLIVAFVVFPLLLLPICYSHNCHGNRQLLCVHYSKTL